MKNNLLLTVAAVAATVVLSLSSCKEQNPVAKSYDDSAALTEKPGVWSGSTPQLPNQSDSTSYLMGYIFGGNINRMIENGRLPELKDIDRTDFERGVAMALQADSTQLDLLYGIMIGLDLRHNINNMTTGREFNWNSTLTYRGYYQGFNNTIPHELPLPMAELDLSNILNPNVDDTQTVEF
ncbi:MAG: hypothetical protein K2O00_05535 [Muribaculaceae bacterium]|nr:hypothetical protein [Muribaculaceae bacterium]